MALLTGVNMPGGYGDGASNPSLGRDSIPELSEFQESESVPAPPAAPPPAPAGAAAAGAAAAGGAGGAAPNLRHTRDTLVRVLFGTAPYTFSLSDHALIGFDENGTHQIADRGDVEVFKVTEG